MRTNYDHFPPSGSKIRRVSEKMPLKKPGWFIRSPFGHNDAYFHRLSATRLSYLSNRTSSPAIQCCSLSPLVLISRKTFEENLPCGPVFPTPIFSQQFFIFSLGLGSISNSGRLRADVRTENIYELYSNPDCLITKREIFQIHYFILSNKVYFRLFFNYGYNLRYWK